MGVSLRSPFRIAELLRTVVFACALAACGSQAPASQPTSLAQTEQAHLAAGRGVDDEYTQALRTRLRTFALRGEPTAIYCDFSSE